MNKTTVSVRMKKLVPAAVIPRYAKNGDAGLDLVAVSFTENDLYIEYKLGLSMQIPNGYAGFILPRSSLSNYHLILANHVGLIDSGYRGEVTARFKKTHNGPDAKYYKAGDKICQLVIMPYPLVLIEETPELDSSERGSGGYGSSGT
jgi:dUTP pyrophosphatase